MDIVVIRSDRRSFAIEIGMDKKIKVRVPRRASKAQIEEILKAKHDWILKTLDKIEQRNTAEAREYEEAEQLSSEEVKRLKERGEDKTYGINRVLGRQNGNKLWAHFYQRPKDKMGKLFIKGKPKLQLSTHALSG